MKVCQFPSERTRSFRERERAETPGQLDNLSVLPTDEVKAAREREQIEAAIHQIAPRHQRAIKEFLARVSDKSENVVFLHDPADAETMDPRTVKALQALMYHRHPRREE